MLLDQIRKPNDIKRVEQKDLPALAGELRELIIDRISKNGGHLASNLGVVELTVALHRSFDLPHDKIIWDVGHQSYAHKILSGRREEFEHIREYGGISGFPNKDESDCDPFTTGHSSASISAGLGLVHARDLTGEDYHVVAVVGDGALTGGMIYEALNNASRLKSNYIIVLNDNNMSISENIGSVSRMMNNIRTTQSYNELKENVSGALSRIPAVGEGLVRQIRNTKSSLKQLFIPGMFFENMGLTYLGPYDGNDIYAMMSAFRYAKRMKKAVVVHVMTKKGSGYTPAERHPDVFHGIGPFDRETGKPLKKPGKTYARIFSRTICRLAEKDGRIAAVTAAMTDGVGLKAFAGKYPDRFFDVGLAEEHAVTFAGGLAAGGMKPFVCIYSSFLQRSYDQLVQDVCLQRLPVTFILDRAGIVGADGETHQGILDISYLSSIPEMTVFAPKNGAEFEDVLNWAVGFDAPLAIRVPRGPAYTGLEDQRSPILYGRGELIKKGEGVALLAAGSMVETAEKVREELERYGISATLINARFLDPADRELILSLIPEHGLIVTMEENVLSGGFGEHVDGILADAGAKCDVINVAVPDKFVKHGSQAELRSECGLDADNVTEKILKKLGIGAEAGI